MNITGILNRLNGALKNHKGKYVFWMNLMQGETWQCKYSNSGYA
jgi:hypothetical protein